MKSLLTALFAASAIGAFAAATAPAPACCAPEPAAPLAFVKPTPSCCAEEKPAAPLTDKSLYQLNSTWANDTGGTVSLSDLRGRPVLLAMFFASCEYACPVLVHDMKRLEAALPEDVRGNVQLVLVTFDTKRDTPPALRAFRERMELGPKWTLLTSTPASVQELAMLLGVKFKQDNRGQFAHSNLITVLNAEGEIVHQHAGLHGDVSPAAKVIAQLPR